MIWNLPQPHVSAQALAEYIAGEIRAAVGPGPDGGPGHVRELAEAVAAFIRDQHPGFARDTGLGSRTAGLPAEYLALLIGRALWSVGDEPAARRLLELQSGALNVPAAFLEAALAPDLSVLHWHVLLASRAVRPAPSSAVVSGTLWVLDLERMLEPAPAGLELTALSVVRQAVDRMAALWDRAEGRGVLGLRGARRVAAGLLGCPPASRKSAGLASEIRALCARRLLGLKSERSWRTTPDVLLLDL